MRLLLDSHTLLWWLDDTLGTLPSNVAQAVESPDADRFVSVASIWEIRIKQSIGKLAIKGDLRQVLDGAPIIQLPVLPEHAHAVPDLPHHHRDPFDRMLIAQALVEELTIVTKDSVFEIYGVPVLWD